MRGDTLLPSPQSLATSLKYAVRNATVARDHMKTPIEAMPHRLAPVVAGDFRARAGRGAAATAPVNIFFAADLTRYDQGPGQPDRRIGDPEVQKGY